MNKITNLVAMTLISIGLFVGCKNDGTHSKYNPWYITAEYDVIENPSTQETSFQRDLNCCTFKM